MGRTFNPGRARRRPPASLLAALVATALAVAGLALFATPGQTRPTSRYVALGDSYAVGTGASDAADGYVGRVGSWLRTKGVTDVANVAVGGETTTSLIEGGQLDRALDAIDDSGSTTRVVTIDIGVNELFAAACKAGVTQPDCPVEADLRRILGEVRAALDGDARGAKVFVVGLFVPFPTAPPAARASVDALLQGTDGRVDCSGTGDQIGMNDLLACLGAQAGATFVGTRGTFALDPAGLIAKDGLHPSDAGHAAIARLIEQADAAPKPVRDAGQLK